MHPPYSSVRLLQTKIRPIHQTTRTSCTVHITYNNQTENKRGTVVARSLDRHVGLKIATRVWRVCPYKCWFLLCCAESDSNVVAALAVWRVIYSALLTCTPVLLYCTFALTCSVLATKLYTLTFPGRNCWILRLMYSHINFWVQERLNCGSRNDYTRLGRY